MPCPFGRLACVECGVEGPGDEAGDEDDPAEAAEPGDDMTWAFVCLRERDDVVSSIGEAGKKIDRCVSSPTTGFVCLARVPSNLAAAQSGKNLE